MLPQGYLASLFTPKSVILAGVSSTPGEMGNTVYANLRNADFQGKIFLAYSDAESILALPVLRKIQDIPQEDRPIDLAVITLPAQSALKALEDLAELPVRAAIVLSAESQENEKKMRELALRNGLLLLGPNSIGLIHTRGKVHASLAPAAPRQGHIGFFSQSGALGVALLDWADAEQIGFSSFVSLGSKILLDESDMLTYLANDPDTHVIVGYVEHIGQGQRFLQQAKLTARQKPIILLRAGCTEAGTRAAASRNQILVDPDSAYEAAFKQSGIFRVKKMEELFHLAQAFAGLPLPQGPGVAILAGADGQGIVAADACARAGLELASFSANTVSRIKTLLPPSASGFNPVDPVGELDTAGLIAVANSILDDPQTHVLLSIFSLGMPMPPEYFAEAMITVFRTRREKPLICCVMGGQNIDKIVRPLKEEGCPCYRFPEQAVEVLVAMRQYGQWKQHPMPVEIGYRSDSHKAAQVIREAKEQGIQELTATQAQELFKAYEIPLLRSELARTSEEAVQIARRFGRPVALKIACSHIRRRAEMGCIMLDLQRADDIRKAFMEITARAKRMFDEIHITGCQVQVMAPKGTREFTVGFRRTRCFGPLVTLVPSGTRMDLPHTPVCRLSPLSLDDVYAMIHETRSLSDLPGVQKGCGPRCGALEDILLILSQMAQDFQDIEEVECDPVLVDDQGAVAAGMRVILSK